MSTANPIQTYYAGCHFRSRLEARWAVFFDYMGIEWLYEPEGYVLSDGTYYLPDFFLPECGTWVEVKGSDATLDKKLMYRAAIELPPYSGERNPEAPSLMILGTPPREVPYGRDLSWTGLADFSNGCGLMEEQWSWTFARWDSIKRPWNDAAKDFSTEPLESTDRTGAMSDAYAMFRSARFEHGENTRSYSVRDTPRSVTGGKEFRHVIDEMSWSEVLKGVAYQSGTNPLCGCPVFTPYADPSGSIETHEGCGHEHR